jgi:uncharacterized protein Yka (UPF0111/DUF47 family)
MKVAPPMSKINELISDVETALEKLGVVYNGLKELKQEIESIENARDQLHGKRSKKDDKPH